MQRTTFCKFNSYLFIKFICFKRTVFIILWFHGLHKTCLPKLRIALQFLQTPRLEGPSGHCSLCGGPFVRFEGLPNGWTENAMRRCRIGWKCQHRHRQSLFGKSYHRYGQCSVSLISFEGIFCFLKDVVIDRLTLRELFER